MAISSQVLGVTRVQRGYSACATLDATTPPNTDSPLCLTLQQGHTHSRALSSRLRQATRTPPPSLRAHSFGSNLRAQKNQNMRLIKLKGKAQSGRAAGQAGWRPPQGADGSAHRGAGHWQHDGSGGLRLLQVFLQDRPPPSLAGLGLRNQRS